MRTEGVVLAVALVAVAHVRALQAEVRDLAACFRSRTALVRPVTDIAFFLERLDDARVLVSGLRASGL